jgi:hypothetical protein
MQSGRGDELAIERDGEREYVWAIAERWLNCGVGREAHKPALTKICLEEPN